MKKIDVEALLVPIAQALEDLEKRVEELEKKVLK